MGDTFEGREPGWTVGSDRETNVEYGQLVLETVAADSPVMLPQEETDGR